MNLSTKSVLLLVLAMFCILPIVGKTIPPKNREESSDFTIESYQQINKRLLEFADHYPELVSIYDAREKFNIKSELQCGEELCKHYVLTLHNKRYSSLSYLPQILLSGELHGDEVVSPQALVELIEYMLQNRAYFDPSYYKSKDSNAPPFLYQPSEWLSFLMDTREIVIIPIANAWGYYHHSRTEKSIDTNRDFPFDMITSQVIKNVMDSNLFVTTITYHAGMMAIAYDWGDTHRHSNISPDYYSFDTVATAMSNYAGKFDKYPYLVGPLNSVVYPVTGGLEEYAYASSWHDHVTDKKKLPPNCKHLFVPPNNVTNRQLIFLIEATEMKMPPRSQLGFRRDLLDPSYSALSKQYIPMIMRSAISLIDLTYPYVYIQTVVQSTQKKSFLTNYENVSLRPSSESSESSSASSPYKKDGTWYQWSTPASNSLQRSKRHPHLRQANSTRATFKSYVNLNITWSVGGCYNVDKTFIYIYDNDALLSRFSDFFHTNATSPLLYTSQDAILREESVERYRQWFYASQELLEDLTPLYVTKPLSGSCYWNSKTPSPADLARRPSYSLTVSVPSVFKDIFLVAAAKVDSQFLQKHPKVEPDVLPQTHFANIRGNASWYAANQNHVLQGQEYFYSLPVYLYLDNENVEYVEDRISFLIDTSFLHHISVKYQQLLYLPNLSDAFCCHGCLIYKLCLYVLILVALLVFVLYWRRKPSPTVAPFRPIRSFTVFDYYYSYKDEDDKE